MVDEGIKYIHDHYPVLFLLLIIICGVVYLSWKLFRLYSRLEKVEETCEKIDVMSTDISSVKDQISKLSSSLNMLLVYLTQQNSNFPSVFFISHSPIQLTPLGEELLKKSGGKAYVDANASELLGSMKRQNFESALDLQNYAQITLYSHTTRGHFNHIKDFIFNNPILKGEGEANIENSIPVIINLMSIYLRNLYFENFPGTKVDSDTK